MSMLRGFSLLLLGGLAACAAPGTPTGARCEGVLLAVNGAAMAVEQLYVSPAAPANWGRDRLAPNTLLPGGTFEMRTGAEPQSVRVVFVDGSAAELMGMDVCANPRLLIGPRSLQPAT
jgi:hypothetical protein